MDRTIEQYIDALPTCPNTGMKIQRYESSCLHEWEPQLPEGWAVFDDVCLGSDPETQKWHESLYVRRIGLERDVLVASAAMVPGVTFTPAEAA